MSRLLTVVGARPQFVKAAPLSHEFSTRQAVDEILVHTGQHFDSNMSDIFFRQLNIPEPAHNLGISGGGHGEMTGKMLAELERVMVREKPDAVLVYGDTNSTLAGALAAAKLHIPIAHVEAGIRSFNRRMPEEINRVLTDHISGLLLCPTDTAVKNLKEEGVKTGVHFVGDVMYDMALYAMKSGTERADYLSSLGLAEGSYAVATLHRAENTEDPQRFDRLLDFLISAAQEQTLIIPVHPRVKGQAGKLENSSADIRLIEPVGYFEMQYLVAGATSVLTDSGGLQKEAFFHGKPCITLREDTEWVETIEAGWNRLWQTPEFKPRRDLTAFGDGKAAQKIADIVTNWIA